MPPPRFRLVAALVVLLLAVTGCGQAADDEQVPTPDPRLNSGVVHTLTGAVRGLVAPDHVLFQGIPYAAAPTGQLRFQPPTQAPAWAGMYDASKPALRCVQDVARDPDYGLGISEDCLSVNVWSPRDAAGLPVMVWIHGGAFVTGSADLYDAQRLAARGRIVVVTVNYRLGALGYLAHPSFGPPDQLGNYGLTDQQAALRWVRNNIGAFGGDPQKVTVAGESAGAMSVCDHLTAPASDGLFRAAIVMSGPCEAQIDVAAARQPSLDYAASVGCADVPAAVSCLRGLPATALKDPVFFGRLGTNPLSGPVTGTSVLPADPVVAMSDGAAARVPVLIGTNRDEFTLFMALEYLRLNREPTAADYPALLQSTFGADAAAVEQRYPLADHGRSASLAYSATVTDATFACVADRMGRDLTAAGARVYSYQFNDRTAPAPDPLRQVPFPVGASHSLELRYLFDVGGAPALDPVQQRLSEQMIGYFSEFVATGVPSAPGAPVWPEFGGADPALMAFDAEGSRVATGFAQEHRCDFWAEIAQR